MFIMATASQPFWQEFQNTNKIYLKVQSALKTILFNRMKVHKCVNFLIAINFNNIKKQRKLWNDQKPSECIHIHINSLFLISSTVNICY